MKRNACLCIHVGVRVRAQCEGWSHDDRFKHTSEIFYPANQESRFAFSRSIGTVAANPSTPVCIASATDIGIKTLLEEALAAW